MSRQKNVTDIVMPGTPLAGQLFQTDADNRLVPIDTTGSSDGWILKRDSGLWIVGENEGGGGGGSGALVQVVNTQTGAVATGSTTIPHDDTIPQNTEGDEYMTLTITPTNAANKLRIDVVADISNGSSLGVTTVALFQDSGASAIAAVADTNATGTGSQVIAFSHYMTAGTTSATTFKVRAGANAGTLTFNGQSGARRYGGVQASSITISEIGAAGSGGVTLPAWLANHPDTPPASPSSFDHEFNTGDTIGGITLGSPATAPVITDNRLVITGGTTGSADVKAVAWTMPTKPFTVRTKVTISSKSANYTVSMLGLRSSVSGRFRTVDIFLNAANQHDFYNQVSAYTALTTRSGFGAQTLYHSNEQYARITYSGSTITFEMSSDGRADNWRTVLTETDSTHFTGGNLPDQVMLGVDSFSGGPCIALFEFLREDV